MIDILIAIAAIDVSLQFIAASPSLGIRASRMFRVLRPVLLGKWRSG